MYTHLHLHSHYSLLQALGDPKAYVAKAKELSMSSLAITDYNGLYGIIEHYKYCKKASIKPLLGVELYLVQNYTIKPKDEVSASIVLLATDYSGYKNLLKLTSHGNLEGRHGKARIDLKLLRDHHTGLICLIGGKNSLLGTMILHNEASEKQTEILQSLIDVFGKDHIVLECIVGNESLDPSITTINKRFIQLANDLSLYLTCSPIVHMINQEDKDSYEIFLCIKDNKRIFDTDRPKVTQPVWMMSEREIYDQMIHNGYEISRIESMMSTTQTISDLIDVEIPLGKSMFPRYESTNDMHVLYKSFQAQYL